MFRREVESKRRIRVRENQREGVSEQQSQRWVQDLQARRETQNESWRTYHQIGETDIRKPAGGTVLTWRCTSEKVGAPEEELERQEVSGVQYMEP